MSYDPAVLKGYEIKFSQSTGYAYCSTFGKESGNKWALINGWFTITSDISSWQHIITGIPTSNVDSFYISCFTRISAVMYSYLLQVTPSENFIQTCETLSSGTYYFNFVYPIV